MECLMYAKLRMKKNIYIYINFLYVTTLFCVNAIVKPFEKQGGIEWCILTSLYWLLNLAIVEKHILRFSVFDHRDEMQPTDFLQTKHYHQHSENQRINKLKLE